MDEIRIAGAGISGLACAITLKQLNPKLKVTVFEKNEDVGLNHHDDYQHMDNWNSKKEIIKTLKVTFGFDIKPCILDNVTKMTCFTPKNKKIILKSKQPMFYVLKRGNKGNTIDNHLKKLAKKAGVFIKFNSTAQKKKINVIATGAKKIQGLAHGFKFKTNLPDGIYGFLDETIAKKDYAYIANVNGEATLANVLFTDFKNATKLRDLCVKKFKAVLGDFSMKQMKEFSGFDAYQYSKRKQKNGIIYIGSAGGFQDTLYGFGIRQALISGYCAAHAIVYESNYDSLWKKHILKEHMNEIVLRWFFDMFNNKGYEFLCSLFKVVGKRIDSLKLIKFFYGSPLIRNPIFYILAKQHMLKTYKNQLKL